MPLPSLPSLLFHRRPSTPASADGHPGRTQACIPFHAACQRCRLGPKNLHVALLQRRQFADAPDARAPPSLKAHLSNLRRAPAAPSDNACTVWQGGAGQPLSRCGAALCARQPGGVLPPVPGLPAVQPGRPGVPREGRGRRAAAARLHARAAPGGGRRARALAVRRLHATRSLRHE